MADSAPPLSRHPVNVQVRVYPWLSNNLKFVVLPQGQQSL